MRELQNGVVYINSGTIGAEAHLPFGGVKATGNGHRDNGPAALDAFTEWKTVFVDYGLPGEEAVVELHTERAGVLMGRVVEVLKASPHRVEAPCRYFGECGGCNWQHIDYGHQLQLKRHIVSEQLRRIGRLPMHRFRRRWARLTLGLLKPHPLHGEAARRYRLHPAGHASFPAHRRVPDRRSWINAALPKLQGHGGGLHQVAIRRGVKTGDVLVQPDLSSIDLSLPASKKYYEEELLGHRFRISEHPFSKQTRRKRNGLSGSPRSALTFGRTIRSPMLMRASGRSP
jgi:hypothetical protein